MSKIIIFGAGKIAGVLHAYLADDANLSVAGFTCDRAFMVGDKFCGLPLVPFEDVEKTFPAAKFAMLVAIGYQELNAVRAERCRQARNKGYKLVSWMSPRAHVAKGCGVGENSIVMDGAVLQPHASLGDNVFVWSGAVVGHHAAIGDHCWLASNCTVSSGTKIEPSCFLGVNTAIGHNITIGARSIIGAGGVVTHCAPSDSVYAADDTERLGMGSERFTKIARMA